MTTEPAAGAADPPPPKRGRGRWVVAGAVLAAAAAALVVWLVVRDDGDDDGLASRDTDSPGAEVPDPVEPDLDEGGETLLDLLARGREQNYHAVYEVEGEAVDGSTVIEVWRRDGDIRQDVRSDTSAGRSESVGMVVDDTTTLCSKTEDQPWVCSEQEGSSETQLDGVFGSVTDQLDGVDVATSDDEVDGRPVQCFSLEGDDGPIGICVTEDGIPARLDGAGESLVLTELSDDVPSDVFEPPAEPVQSGEGG